MTPLTQFSTSCLAIAAAVVSLAGAVAFAAAAAPKAAQACPVGASISERDLPRQARDVLALIQAGGPFPYDRDGIVFQNRERILPRAPRGHYREYTVRTPGIKNRGARRIVCGGVPQSPDACYYTEDHYATFRCIVP